MTRRIGLLSVSMAALGLAVAGYFVQGAGAGSAPVEVADFGVPQASVAQTSGGDEYDRDYGETELFHPAAVMSGTACGAGPAMGVVPVTQDVSILCKSGEALGFLVTARNGEIKLVESIEAKDECPSRKSAAQPDA